MAFAMCYAKVMGVIKNTRYRIYRIIFLGRDEKVRWQRDRFVFVNMTRTLLSEQMNVAGSTLLRELFM